MSDDCMMVDAIVELGAPADFDLRRSQELLQMGPLDPCMRIERDASVWRATRTPDGPATYCARRRDDRVEVAVWGPGTGWVVHHVSALLGLADRPERFVPAHATLATLHARAPIYLPSSLQLFEQLVPTILQQLVTWREAMLAYRGIVRDHGEPAPGPVELWLAPGPTVLARVPSHRLSAHGVLGRHAQTIRRAATALARVEPAAHEPEPLSAHLEAVPGIGRWTAQVTLASVLGHADAVPTGDYHLPHAIAWALAGEPRADDARMLELLAPFTGHRWRVICLLRASGNGAPRRGPRRGMQTRRRIRGDGP